MSPTTQGMLVLVVTLAMCSRAFRWRSGWA